MALPQDRPVRGGGELSVFPDWSWIALTILAAGLQALRTAAQKWLGGQLSTDAATYVRYLFALPVAIVYAAALAAAFGVALPVPTGASLAWAALGAASQVAATRFLLMALSARNFAVGVAYSKTDVVQAALFEALVLGAAITLGAAAGIAIATAGVMLISLKGTGRPWAALAEGLSEASAHWGLLSGACFAVAGVAVRGAVLSLAGEDAGAGVAGASAVALLSVLTLQVGVMGLYLIVREPQVFLAIARTWRPAVFAGVASGIGSTCWFLALGLQQVAYVRTLGLVEILATVALSRFLFKESPKRRELIGIAVLLAGIVLVLNAG